MSAKWVVRTIDDNGKKLYLRISGGVPCVVADRSMARKFFDEEDAHCAAPLVDGGVVVRLRSKTDAQIVDDNRQLEKALLAARKEIDELKLVTNNPVEYVAWLEYRNRLLSEVHRLFRTILFGKHGQCMWCYGKGTHEHGCSAERAMVEYVKTYCFKP